MTRHIHPCPAWRLRLLAALCLSVLPSLAMAQAYQGYTLYSPLDSRTTFLLDMNNTVVHSWSHNRTGGYACYLLPDGSLLRPALSSNSSLNGGAAAGIVQRVAWNGAVLWEYTYSSSTYRSHHDIEPMPNGNVLLIAWEVKTAAQALAAGLNHSASIWPDHIVEIQPVGSTGGIIVWEWHAWDHLIQDYSASKSNYGVVANHPELIDINVGSTFGDWMHVNGISYNPVNDQIAFSSHNLDEIYVIDHSTTTAQAAGHSGGNSGRGGDILYRWGRPSNYRAPGAQVFNVVHCAWWIPAGLPGAGNLLAYNNREGTNASWVMEITPPVNGSGQYILVPNTAYGPSAAAWTYAASGFYSNHLGGNQRLPNGNTLICESTSGRIFEVTPSGSVVWNYQTTGQIARALRYPASYTGLINLPVTYTALHGYVADQAVRLSWTVASESSNHGFEVLRRLAGEEGWEVRGFVPGRGTTSVSHDYTWSEALTGTLVAAGSATYRLRQIDTDGSARLSSLIDISIDAVPGTVQMLQAWPNPVLTSGAGASVIANVQYRLAADAPVRLSMHNAIGQEVAVPVDAVMPVGVHVHPWDVRGLPSGVYHIRLAAGPHVRTMRLVIGS